MFNQRNLRRHILAFLVVGGWCASDAKAEIVLDQGYVHVIYLSPSDALYDPGYESVLNDTIIDLQHWYSEQLNGASFSLARDPVTWFQLDNPESFYQQKPGFGFEAMRFWNQILEDAKSVVDWAFGDPNDIYLFYVDADPLPHQAIGGTSGVAMMAANDLRGLTGRPLVPINPGDADLWSTYPSGPDRWEGGLGHEFGHALGLDHPGNQFGNTIMQFGYLYYPATSLAPAQKQFLLQSPFITADYSTPPVPVPEPVLTAVFVCGGLGFLLFLRRRERRNAVVMSDK
jgi:hypothetical protein